LQKRKKINAILEEDCSLQKIVSGWYTPATTIPCSFTEFTLWLSKPLAIYKLR